MAVNKKVLLGFLMLSGTPAPAVEDIYRQDIDFFLTELENRAGHFFEQKKIDWGEVSAWCHRELEKVENNADHLRLCARLAARLKDGHARLHDARVEWPDQSGGRKWRLPKVGMLYSGKKALVASVDPALGIPLGSEVTAVDGQPIISWLNQKVDTSSDRRGYSTRRQGLHQMAEYGLGGWENTTFRLVFSRPDKTEGELEITRDLGEKSPVRPDFQEQLGTIRWVGEKQRSGWTKTALGNGYIRLRKVPRNLPEQLDKILVSIGDVPGMILDMRGNGGGGCDHQAVFSRFIGKGEFWGRLEGNGTRPYAGPMVVIVDANTASAGETVSGMFSEDQRAYMIGTSPTAGMSSQKIMLKAPSGLFSMRFSVRSNKKRFNQGRGIEGIGITPHEIVDWKMEDLANGRDTLVMRAEELLKIGYWPDAIDYDGSGKVRESR